MIGRGGLDGDNVLMCSQEDRFERVIRPLPVVNECVGVDCRLRQFRVPT